MIDDLNAVALGLLARGKGILAADETPRTLSRRFEALDIESTPESRRDYREMLFTSPGLGRYVSGAILQDETIRQDGRSGTSLVHLLGEQGIVAGIKVDTGAKPLAGSPEELVTEGLDGLRGRLSDYGELGARFAKWRAVIRIAGALPSPACILANAQALARYAALCQEQQILPIVEPEVLMDGDHSIDRCEAVTDRVLHAVFDALFDQGVVLERMLLKPNMVIPALRCGEQATADGVAAATLRCMRRRVPAAVPGIVFLSGGQDERRATEHLDAINRLPGAKPWAISFSYGRALQDAALKAWAGREANVEAGQEALLHRAQCNSAAAIGAYEDHFEELNAAEGFRLVAQAAAAR